MFKRKLIQVFSYFPFKLNFFILAFVTLLVFYWSKQNYFVADDTSIYALLLKSLSIILFVFSGLIFSISLVTVLLAWLHFIILQRHTLKSLLKVKFGEGNFAQAGKIPLEISLFSAIRPLLGIVKARLEFADLFYTDEIVLNENIKQPNNFLRSGIIGAHKVTILDRKEYNLVKVFLFFEDIFRLFSFPLVEKGEKIMYVIPPKAPLHETEVLPNRTEEQDQRIKLPKKVQGEYVNYKSFEAGDDIRRIVWKIYAKNKELVIRIPETTDPYASHIYLYPSFYNSLGGKLSFSFDQEFLNFYKDKVRNIFESIAENGFDMRYQSDQVLDNLGKETKETVMLQITSSNWHKDKSVYELFGRLTDGVLIISSLTSVKDLEQALENKKAGTYIILVKLSEMFAKKSPFGLKQFFFRTGESKMTILKRNWILSGYRKLVLKNEKNLEQIIKNQIFN